MFIGATSGKSLGSNVESSNFDLPEIICNLLLLSIKKNSKTPSPPPFLIMSFNMLAGTAEVPNVSTSAGIFFIIE